MRASQGGDRIVTKKAADVTLGSFFDFEVELFRLEAAQTEKQSNKLRHQASHRRRRQHRVFQEHPKHQTAMGYSSCLSGPKWRLLGDQVFQGRSNLLELHQEPS